METCYVRCKENTGYELSLTLRQVYVVIPNPVEINGMLRVIDDTGED